MENQDIDLSTKDHEAYEASCLTTNIDKNKESEVVVNSKDGDTSVEIHPTCQKEGDANDANDAKAKNFANETNEDAEAVDDEDTDASIKAQKRLTKRIEPGIHDANYPAIINEDIESGDSQDVDSTLEEHDVPVKRIVRGIYDANYPTVSFASHGNEDFEVPDIFPIEEREIFQLRIEPGIHDANYPAVISEDSEEASGYESGIILSPPEVSSPLDPFSSQEDALYTKYILNGDGSILLRDETACAEVERPEALIRNFSNCCRVQSRVLDICANCTIELCERCGYSCIQCMKFICYNCLTLFGNLEVFDGKCEKCQTFFK